MRKTVDEVYKDEFGKVVFWADRNEDFASKNTSGKIFLMDPLDYPALVFVMKKCDFLMTDSGGLQEEAPTFGKKILVLRKSTEARRTFSTSSKVAVPSCSRRVSPRMRPSRRISSRNGRSLLEILAEVGSRFI